MTAKTIKLPNALVYPVTIDEVHVTPGQWVRKGDPIYTVAANGGQMGRINAPFDGQIASDPVARNTVFDQPQAVIRITPGDPPAAAPRAASSALHSQLFELFRTDAPVATGAPETNDQASSTPSPSSAPPSTPPSAQPTPAPRPAPPKASASAPTPLRDRPAQTRAQANAPSRRGGFLGLVLAVLFLPVLAGAVYLFADASGVTYGGLPGGLAYGSATIIAAFVLLLGVPRGPSFGQTLSMALLAGGVVAFLSQSPGLGLPGFGGFRATVPPEVEAPVAASLVRSLDAFRHPAPFGIRTGFVNDGEILVTMQYAPGHELQRSIHVRDIDRIDARKWTLELYDYVSLTLRCKTPGCATTHRDEGNGDGIFFEPDHLLVRVYYRDNLHRVHSLIDDIARLAALYGNDELTIRKSSF